MASYNPPNGLPTKPKISSNTKSRIPSRLPTTFSPQTIIPPGFSTPKCRDSQGKMIGIHQHSITHETTPASVQYMADKTASGTLLSSVAQLHFPGHCLNTSTSTLSLISSSAVSMHESPKSNVLRRKPSIIGEYTSQRRAKLSSEVKAGPLVEPNSEDVSSSSVFGLNCAHASTDRCLHVEQVIYGSGTDLTNPLTASGSHVPRRAPYTVQPLTPFSESSVTPSIRDTDSPGAFSHATSATSQTSYSPLVAASPFSESPAWTSPSKSRKINHLRTHRDNLGIEVNLPQTLPLSSSDGQASRKVYKHSRLPLRGTSFTQFKGVSAAPMVAPVLPPPELAHLLIDPVSPRPNDQIVPSRPSRDGTSNLDDQQRASPIIRSTLAHVHSTHRRRRSSLSFQESGLVHEVMALNSRVAQLSRRLSRTEQPPSPDATYATPSLGTSTTRGQYRNDALNVTGTNKLQEASNPSVATSNKSGSRFGRFIRRPKTDDLAVNMESAKPSKKGPAAGTGHEGYGENGVGGRNATTTSVSKRTIRPTSARSTTGSSSKHRSSDRTRSCSQIEVSLHNRLDPVYIRGNSNGSVSQIPSAGISRAGSSQSSIDSEARLTSSTTSPKISQSSSERFGLARRRFGLQMPARMSKSNQNITINRRLSSETSDSGASPWLPNFSNSSFSSISRLSRELSRVSSAADFMPIRPLHPASISGQRNKQKRLEILRTQSALSPYSADVKINKTSTWAFLKSFQHSKQPQKGNFLQRMHKPLSHNDTALAIPVHTSRDAYSKTVAHYAILDAEESIGIEDLHSIMQEANVSRSVDNLHPFGWASNLTQVHRPVKQTPAPAAFTSFLEMSSHTSETSRSDQEEKIRPIASGSKQDAIEAQSLKTTTQLRPSRLAHMGKVAKEVSKSDRDRTLPIQSFSRPFVISQPNPSHRVLSLREASSQSARNHTHLTLADVQHSGPLGAVTEGHRLLRNESSILKTLPKAADPVGDSELISFPARKNSDICYSNSSGTMSLPTRASTAVVPPPGSPPSEDEIWKEYDDLIDDVLTPSLSATSPSMGSLCVRSDYFANRETKQVNLGRYTDQGKTVFPRLHTNETLSPAKYGSHLLGGCDQDSVTNTSTTSISGFAAAYGEHNLESTSTSKPIRPVSECTSPSTIRSSIRSRLRNSGSSKYSRSAANMEIQSRDTRQSKSTELSRTAVLSYPDPQVMTNLEFSSLMIGKWLSFGRVLFSPAHFELKNLREDRILVVDGLGKEWSYYVALTYPNATVYSLGPSPSHSSTRYTFGAFESLPNHRHIAQVNMSSNFPFPKGFFAAMVIRFPAAASDVTLRSMISECKRVLRPGGYVEISTLDLDLTNMGNHARRALRELKIRMQVADPNISLKPVSDNIQHLLGRRGFENLNRCTVGIPAAGGSSDSYEQPKDEKNVPFTELLTDYSSAGDERITKMVARVGRWWYMRCYETGGLPDGDFTRTIWIDNNLLSECEKMQTTFKLLVCYAQKPTVTQRRTVSL